MNSTTLLTWLKGNFIASDSHGNKYYEERFYFGTPTTRQPRRWVVYKGKPEASKVPAEWHAWLHFTNDQTPMELPLVSYDWIKPHLPNLTGTKKAYEPAVDRKANYYKAWTPEQMDLK